ncbi:MAG TPA: tetratricopeptide repeat protein [Candidatus Angelobacter sp.]|nr:tetratricopeptide repeat protein [Candidatus Angelobacter sp.]
MLTQRRASRSIEAAIECENWLKARRLIREALRRAPNDHWLLTRLALTYYEQRQYRKALHYDVKALNVEPHCPLAIWGYAGALDMLERRKEALQIYRWLISWGEDRLAYGQCGEGIQHARSLIADCFYRIARIHERNGQRKKAIAAYETHLSRRNAATRSIYPLKAVRNNLRALERVDWAGQHIGDDCR